MMKGKELRTSAGVRRGERGVDSQYLQQVLARVVRRTADPAHHSPEDGPMENCVHLLMCGLLGPIRKVRTLGERIT